MRNDQPAEDATLCACCGSEIESPDDNLRVLALPDGGRLCPDCSGLRACGHPVEWDDDDFGCRGCDSATGVTRPNVTEGGASS